MIDSQRTPGACLAAVRQDSRVIQLLSDAQWIAREVETSLGDRSS